LGIWAGNEQFHSYATLVPFNVNPALKDAWSHAVKAITDALLYSQRKGKVKYPKE